VPNDRPPKGWYLTIRLLFGGVLAALFVTGAFFVTMGVREWLVAADSRTWTEVSAVITSSEVHSQRRTGRRGGGSVAVVTYRYLAAGEERTGSRVHFRVQGPWDGGPEGLSRRYPVGQSVRAFVDPSDPSRAVLEPGSDWTNALPIAMGVLAMITCLGLATIVRRWIRFAERALPERGRAASASDGGATAA
jgi:hypothetical protein